VLADSRPYLHAKSLTYLGHRLGEVSNPASGAADVVEIFAVTQWLDGVELVQAGAAPEYQLVAEVVVVGYLDDQSGEQQVLLDLLDRRPRNCAAPLGDGGAGPGLVREHLGHSSIRVTMDVYGHLYEDTKDEIAQRLQAIHRGL